MKILKFLFILLLILFPIGEILRFDVGNNIVLKPLDFVAGITVVWWMILQAQSSKFKIQNLKKHYFILPLVSFVAIGFAALVINLAWLKPQEFIVSLLYLLRFVSYAFLLPVTLQFDKIFRRKIIFILLIDGLVILILGYFQYFFFNSLKSLYYLGWDEHKHRIFSTFFDPNFTGAFYVLYLLIIAGLLYEVYRKQKQQETIALSVLLLLTLLAVFLTFSRSALLMLIVGGITFFVLIKKKKLLFFLFGAILLFGIIASPKFHDENMNLFREASSKARVANIETALRIIQDRPILGVGFNSYRYTKSLYHLQHDWVNAPSHADAGVDNSYLFVLATTGIIGFGFYLWLWIAMIKNAFVLYHKKMMIGAIIVISSIFAIFTNALFINSLFFSPLMLWLWLEVGLIEEF